MITFLVGMNLTLYGKEVQKVGASSMTTLKISTSVRAAAMGDAFVATADDISSIFWNPAGLFHLQKQAAYFTNINMPADIQFNTIAAARNLGRKGVLGIHLLAMNTGDMPIRTIFHPDGTGENFIAYDVVGGISYAQKFTDRFIYGLNFRLAISGIEDESYTGFLGDFGILYETALRSLKLGMSIQNFGPDIKYSGEYYDYLDQGRRARSSPQKRGFNSAPPPTIYRIGLSADFFEFFRIEKSEGMKGFLSLEMSHPNDNRERLNLGLEFQPNPILSLRAGYKFRIKNSFGYDEERWTVGWGLKIPIPTSSFVFHLDYAFVDLGKIREAGEGFSDQPHRFALGINF
ncbi:MAG: PorV/PorQ family protein [bacterium]